MSEFDDNLWREVQRAYGAELADAPDPLRRRSRRRVPLLAGTSIGVVGGSVAAVIVLSAASSPPAFAVTRHADGTVSVMIRRIEGIAGANRRLALLGIHARAVAVSEVCTASPPHALAQVGVATVRGRQVNWVGVAPGRIAERIHPAEIPAGHTLVIPAVPGGAQLRLVRGRAVSGKVPACLPPVVFIGRGPGSAGGRTVICRAGITQSPHPVVAGVGTSTNGTDTNGTGTTATNGTATNATGTNPAPSQTTVGANTNTNAGTSTTAGTGATVQGTAINGATTMNGRAPTGSATGGGANVPLPPPLLRHCPLTAAERLALAVPKARATADRGGSRKAPARH